MTPWRAIVIVLLLAAHAGAVDVICQKRSGAIVARQDRCRRREQTVPLYPFGPPGPAGEPGEPGPPALYPTIRDSTGAFVGVPALSVEGSLGTNVEDGWVAIRRLGERALAIPVDPAGLRPGGTLWFTGAACSGTTMLSKGRAETFLDGVVVVGGVAYYTSGPPRSIAIATFAWDYDAYCESNGGTFLPPNLCCYEYGGTELAADVVVLAPEVVGVPPFQLEGVP